MLIFDYLIVFFLILFLIKNLFILFKLKIHKKLNYKIKKCLIALLFYLFFF